MFIQPIRSFPPRIKTEINFENQNKDNWRDRIKPQPNALKEVNNAS